MAAEQPPSEAGPYRLEALAELAGKAGLDWRRLDGNRLDVLLWEDCALAFCNLPDAQTLIGFDGMAWHAHGSLHFAVGESGQLEYDELEVLLGLITGELLVVSQHVDGVLCDRWLVHKGAALELKDVQPGEELHVRRLAESPAEQAERAAQADEAPYN